MIKKIVAAQPDVRTVIFQDDIFAFTSDKRVLPLCAAIQDAKRSGAIPPSLQFIATNRIDAMTPERLAAMRRAGFRVLGFGVESFSRAMLEEFNKGQIFRHIEPVLTAALAEGFTPFLDLILCSPRARLQDVAETIREAYRWLLLGCEIGMYPYVVPFTGSKMSTDPELAPFVTTKVQTIQGTGLSWPQPDHILPIDLDTRQSLEKIVVAYERSLAALTESSVHLPSRARSLLWIANAIPVLRAAGVEVPDAAPVLRKLQEFLGQAKRPKAKSIRREAVERVARAAS